MIDNSDVNTEEVTDQGTTEPSKRPSWDNVPTLKQLQQNIQDAHSDKDAEDTKIKTRRANLNPTFTPVRKGLSSIAPKVIRKQAEWKYSSLSEPFLSTEDLFDVKPATHLDKEAAKQNQAVLNYQFNNKIDKVDFINSFVRRAVNDGTVITRVGWEYEEEVVTEIVPVYQYVETDDPQTLQHHQMLMGQIQQNPEIINNLPEHIAYAHELTVETGIPHAAIHDGTEEVERINVLKNHPTVEVCNPLNLTIDPSCKGNLAKAGFIGYSMEQSYADLVQSGLYFDLDKIQVDNNSPESDADFVRNMESSFKYSDKPRKKLVVQEYWGYWDIEGDNTVEPIVAAWVGSTLIRLEKNPYPGKMHPFDSAKYLHTIDENFGESDGDLLIDNQNIIGAVSRGMVDILAKSANGQVGSRKDALDITNKRKYQNGEDYEFNPQVDPRQAFHMGVYPEIPQSAQIMLSNQYAEAESMTGTKSFSNGISGEALGSTATGIRSAMDATSKRELDILRRLANGIINIGKKVIAMNAEFLSDEEVIRITDEEFFNVKRENLIGNFDLKLTISTAEADNQKAEELAFMLQTTAQAIGPEMTTLILADIARLRKMPALAKKLEDYQPQPDPLAERKAQLEIELLQAQIVTEQSKAIENRAQAQLDIAKARSEGSKADKQDLDYVEQETGVTQERDLQKQKAQSEGNMNLELLKKALDPSTEQKTKVS